MSIDSRIRDIAGVQGFDYATIRTIYERRYKIISDRDGKEYAGRESHMRYFAFKDTEIIFRAKGANIR